MKRIILPLLFTLSLAVNAQNLRPSIGIGAMPADGDSVCYIPFYTGGFNNSGLQRGDTAYDFTLYDLNGDTLTLSQALAAGRPVLLIGGNYTCPVFRNKVPVINNLMNTYAGQIDVYIIYGVEAHPDVDTSIYFGFVNTTSTNVQAGILYRQPKTYGERKTVASEMLAGMTIQAPVFIDGPCNNWWSAYGPAPNNAYLIDTNGIVFAKHAWFDKYPDNIYCDIDSLLGTTGNCTTTSGNSSFTYSMVSSDTVYDESGVTLSVDGELHNTSADDLLIYARRVINNMPPGWASSICIDVCYSTTTDSVVFLLPAGTIQPIHLYFYTAGSLPDTGFIRLRLRNMNNSNNQATINAYGITYVTTGVSEYGLSNFLVYPNPATEIIRLSNFSETEFETRIYDISGEEVICSLNEYNINVSSLKAGIYFLKNYFKKSQTTTRFIKIN